MNTSRLTSTFKLTNCLPVLLVAIALPMHTALAADTESVTTLSDVDVEDTLQVLQREPISSVVGFGKSVLETPRGVTSISNELMNSVTITEIDDLVAMSPGSFTQSFFGVAGSLDVRGSPGENYFRGVRRIDNPGNYPQAIGASDHVDIVRGPASPIYGPSKIGGYLNFVPKSARATTGQYLKEATGELGITTGSWSKKILSAEVGGPGKMLDKPFGYYLYAESENSGSYYENTSTLQSIVQASFDMNLTDSLRTEFGGMYQDFKGNQVAGWNRLTQDLVDNGTYITGSPASRDTNGDGLMSNAESAGLFGFFSAPANAALLNPGTAHIDGSQVLVQEDDTLEDQVLTLYADFIYELPSGLKITNKSFYESLDNNNENAYGFSQFANTWVLEDQLIFAFGKRFSSVLDTNFQISPSIRYQNFEHGDDFDFEYFDRRDITGPGTPVDRRTLATRGQDPFSNHIKGSYTDSGIGFMSDITLFGKLNLLGGVRYDSIYIKSASQLDSTTNPGLSDSGTFDATSWSASLSYDLPFGLRPYVTAAKQSTLIVGQGGQIDYEEVAGVDGKSPLGNSELTEYGLKMTLFGGRLYIAADHFDQKRVDLNAQDTVTSNTTQSKGEEIEFTWVVTPQISLIGAYTHLNVYNLTAEENGSQFSFLGAEDLVKIGIDPLQAFGGVVGGVLPITSGDSARKAGIPEQLVSLNIIANLDKVIKGVTASVGVTDVSAVWSGYAKSVRLPAYTLVNAGLHYESAHWKAALQVKNLTDERYFRSNFPDLFGSSIVLPELPRNYILSAGYKF